MDARFDLRLTPLLVSLGAGVVVTLIILLLVYGVIVAPKDDRENKDPLPFAFSVIWLGVRWLAPVVTVILSDWQVQAIEQRLRKAGLEYTLSPSQFYAARIVGSLSAGLVVAWTAKACAPLLGMSTPSEIACFLVGALLGWIYPLIWLKDRESLRMAEVQKALPFYLDIITLCVEAGLNLPGALKQAIDKGPKGVLRNEFQRVIRDIRAGSGRAVALRAMAERLAEPDVTHFISATIQAEAMGASLGPVLRVQADQRRADRFLRAEKKAMQAPVKMLLPLSVCIFPCTLVVILLPIGIKFLNAGY